MPAVRVVLWVLLFVWVVALVGSFALGQLNEARTGRSLPDLQRSTSAMLVMMAWAFFLGGMIRTRLRAFSLFIALGMSVSFVSDLIMASVIDLPDNVLGGMVSFGIAHCLYILAFCEAARAYGICSQWVTVASVAATCAVGAGVWMLAVRNSDDPVHSMGALAYTLIICTMAGFTVPLIWQDHRFLVLFGGAVLFVVSDVMLGKRLLRGASWYLISDMIWWAYICGQALIVWTQAVVSPPVPEPAVATHGA